MRSLNWRANPRIAKVGLIHSSIDSELCRNLSNITKEICPSANARPPALRSRTARHKARIEYRPLRGRYVILTGLWPGEKRGSFEDDGRCPLMSNKQLDIIPLRILLFSFRPNYLEEAGIKSIHLQKT